MRYQEFLQRCREFLAKVDTEGTESVKMYPIPDSKAEEIRTEISYMICHRLIGVEAGYYRFYQLKWEGNKKTYFVDFEPTDKPRLWGETSITDDYFYAFIKSYGYQIAPKRFNRNYYYGTSGVDYFYTIIYHKERRIKPFAGRSYINEEGIYNDIAVAARISESASRFIVPVQDHKGNVVGYTPIGNKEIIFNEVLREAIRRRLMHEMEEDDRRES
jgi:hypothetical protein